MNSNDILYKLKTEGIGSSIAGMHRGLQLLNLLIESDEQLALKYFKGVAAACEHISGKLLDENYKPTKTTISENKISTPNIPSMPKDFVSGASFILDGMTDEVKENNNKVAPVKLHGMSAIADNLL